MNKTPSRQEARRKFVQKYIEENDHKQRKVVIQELSERLFLSERTIYNILNSD